MKPGEPQTHMEPPLVLVTNMAPAYGTTWRRSLVWSVWYLGPRRKRTETDMGISFSEISPLPGVMGRVFLHLPFSEACAKRVVRGSNAL